LRKTTKLKHVGARFKQREIVMSSRNANVKLGADIVYLSINVQCYFSIIYGLHHPNDL